MNPLIPRDDTSGLPVHRQNPARQDFFTDHPLVSLPDKDELLLIVHLNQIHKHRQKMPTRRVKHTLCFSPQRSSDDEKG